MRLIDADALKNALEEMKIVIDEDIFECNSIHEELVYLLEKIDTVLAEKIYELPTIEAVPVVHGEWILGLDEFDVEFIECPFCKEEFYDGENDTFDILPNFCPNCGADMR